jgi:hypothetical protein
VNFGYQKNARKIKYWRIFENVENVYRQTVGKRQISTCGVKEIISDF